MYLWRRRFMAMQFSIAKGVFAFSRKLLHFHNTFLKGFFEIFAINWYNSLKVFKCSFCNAFATDVIKMLDTMSCLPIFDTTCGA